MNSKSSSKSNGFNRVDTLIITVGTRQVGWHCQDGVVRCLGADGDRGAPPHIDELYREELKIERSCHQEGESNSRWGVRHLGEQCYQRCQNDKSFHSVELLLDYKIIADGVGRRLKHIILWGTNQPETVPWNYRRADTLWLARLMAGKIQEKWPKLKVDVWPDVKDGDENEKVLDANNSEAIRIELEDYILPYVFQSVPQAAANLFTLMIQNKGAVPAVANGLEICAAALVRQCQVFNVSPEEPKPLYQNGANEFLSAQTAQTYQTISVGEYFWPLERMRVISAWKRGDFREAEIWLTSHQSRYEGVLYKLAGYLALSTNWQIDTFLNDKDQGIESWLQSEALAKVASVEQIQVWKTQLAQTRSNEPAMAWESVFLIEPLLLRGSYTSAFMQFAQCLERLLYIRYLNQGYVRPYDRPPEFSLLIERWSKTQGMNNEDESYKLFHNIRITRNDIVHSAKPTSVGKIVSIWTNRGWVLTPTKGSENTAIMQRMIETLQMVFLSDWKIPEQMLLRSLYEWGLALLLKASLSPVE